jgi:hypothetical protein
MVNGYFFVLPPMEMEKFPSKRVAPAFVHQALETKTTRSIVTVDGGNIAAALH